MDERTWNPEDVQLMRLLMDKGCDLDEIREIEHCFIAGDKESAELIAASLIKLGHKPVKIIEEEDEEDEDVYVRIESLQQSSPSEVTINTAALIDLAKRYNASYDGWGTSV